MTERQIRLWDVEHPYYCADQSYYKGDDNRAEYGSWQAWKEEENDQSDPDMNLLFRFDWEEGTLKLYYMAQRKGYFRVEHIKVSRDDEPEVRAWLKERFAYLLKLWEPLVQEVLPGYDPEVTDKEAMLEGRIAQALRVLQGDE